MSTQIVINTEKVREAAVATKESMNRAYLASIAAYDKECKEKTERINKLEEEIKTIPPKLFGRGRREDLEDKLCVLRWTQSSMNYLGLTLMSQLDRVNLLLAALEVHESETIRLSAEDAAFLFPLDNTPKES